MFQPNSLKGQQEIELELEDEQISELDTTFNRITFLRKQFQGDKFLQLLEWISDLCKDYQPKNIDSRKIVKLIQKNKCPVAFEKQGQKLNALFAEEEGFLRKIRGNVMGCILRNSDSPELSLLFQSK